MVWWGWIRDVMVIGLMWEGGRSRVNGSDVEDGGASGTCWECWCTVVHGGTW